MNQCLWNPPKELPLFFLAIDFFHAESKSRFLKSKGTVSFPVSLWHWEDGTRLCDGLSLLLVSLQYQTGYCVYFFSSIKHKRQDVLSCKSHPSRSKIIYRTAKISSFAFSSRGDEKNFHLNRVNLKTVTGWDLKYWFSYLWKVTTQSIHRMQSKDRLTSSRAANALEPYRITFKSIH